MNLSSILASKKRIIAIAGAVLTSLTGISLTQESPDSQELYPISIVNAISPDAQAKLQAAQKEFQAAQEKVAIAMNEVRGQVEAVKPKVEAASDSIEGVMNLFRENPLIAILAGGAMLLFGDIRKPKTEQPKE